MITKRQEEILKIIEKKAPITGDEIGRCLGVTKGALRTDFAFLKATGAIISKTRVGYTLGGKSKKIIIDEKKVIDYMTTPNLLDAKSTVYQAILSITLKDAGSIYVVEEDTLLGVVSRKDMLKHLIGGEDNKNSPLSLVMTRVPNVITINEGETILEAAKKMVTHEIDSLPVLKEVDGEKKVVGKISKTTITKVYVYEGGEEVEW